MTTSIWYGVAMALGFWAFGVELSGNLLTQSIALYSDAWHLLADTIPLGLGWHAARVQARGLDSDVWQRRTTGVNIIALASVGAFIAWETFARYGSPQLVGRQMFTFAAIGWLLQGLQYACSHKLKHPEAHTGFGQRLHALFDWMAATAVLLGGYLIYSGLSPLWDTAMSGMVAIASFGAVLILYHELRHPHAHSHSH